MAEQGSDAHQRLRKSAMYRSPHRRRSHEEAHADAHGSSSPAVFSDPLVPANDPPLVAQQDDLEALVASLRAAGQFGYDSEFIGEQTYFPHLCLLQVATTQAVTLIDPKAGLDLTSFWELLADASVEKIVHAGLQDLEPVVRHLGQPARHVFDTQIAAGFTLIDQVRYPASLGSLVEALIGADMGKGLKFSQWDHRPLSQVQEWYAATDVRYLPLLRQRLGQRLADNGNAAWAQEECDALAQAELYQRQSTPRRVKAPGIRQLRPRQRAVVEALAAWREQTAREQDLPARALLADDLIVEIARLKVEDDKALGQVRGLPRPLRQAFGPAILATIRTTLDGALDLLETPRYYDRDRHRDAINRVWEAIEEICAKRQLNPGVVTSKKELVPIICSYEEKLPPPDTHLAQGWRHELLAPVIDPLLGRAG